MIRTVVLHGALGARFGRRFDLDIASPLEAVRALMAQLQGFRQHFRNGHYRIVRRYVGKRIALGLDELELKLGRATELHIVPVVSGAASGLAKVLVGVAIIGLAIAAPYALGLVGAGGTALGTTAIGLGSLGSITFGQIAAVGLGLALSGVAQMLAPAPKGGAADSRQGFLFSGQDNVTSQGGPVPVVIGRFLVGSTVISAGLNAEQTTYIPIGSNLNPPTLGGP